MSNAGPSNVSLAGHIDGKSITNSLTGQESFFDRCVLFGKSASLNSVVDRALISIQKSLSRQNPDIPKGIQNTIDKLSFLLNCFSVAAT
jgi:hypothetical protein